MFGMRQTSIAYFFFLLTALLSPSDAKAYPDFIGYGYNTCLVCHYNSHGFGPLTDYGRALFAQEIAARTFVPKSVSDETLGEYSGFVPGVETTPWFRAGIKYRSLWVQNDPGGKYESLTFLHMQREANFVVQSANQRTVLALTYGLLPKPTENYYGRGGKTEAISREHYLRFYPLRDLLVAVGLMDIAYGIRIADHTSVTRGGIGLGIHDQVHGVLMQYLKSNWDASVHVFAGNLLQAEELRRPGVALQGEYEVFEKNRLGASFVMMADEFQESKRMAIHDRWGLPNAPGSSLMVELGVMENTVKATGESTLGSYGMVRGLIHLFRGFNLITQLERRQNEMTFRSAEQQRWTFGVFAFPLQRTEVRLTSVQAKSFSPDPTVQESDRWYLQGQVHVSW
jgi:hypothetical protein